MLCRVEHINSAPTMKLIKLRGKTDRSAIVDDDDYENLIKYRWYLAKHKPNTTVSYANTFVDPENIFAYLDPPFGKSMRMHRLIMNVFDRKIQVDHEDGNGLNNQKSNLRLATEIENHRNRRNLTIHSSIYKGVSWHKGDKKFRARITVENVSHFIGNFDTEAMAAHAYDATAKLIYGEFANLNFPLTRNKT